MLPSTENFVTVSTSLILLLIIFYKWLTRSNASAMQNLPPSPPKLPIIGNFHQLGNLLHRSLRLLSQQYGEYMVVYLGSLPVLIISSVKTASEVIKKHDVSFSSRPQTKTARKLLYNGKDMSLAPYGEYWRQVKGICVLHLLSNQRVRSFKGVRGEEMRLLMERIQNSTLLSESINLSEMFMTFTSDIICKVAFGRKYSQEEICVDFDKLLKEFMELLGSVRISDFVPWLAWIDWINGFNAKVDRIAKEFDEFLERVVQEHENLRGVDQKGEEDDNNDDKVKDFVDVLLGIQKDEKPGLPIDRDGLKALILDIFSGGIDTSSVMLEWTMAELLKHPKIMLEVQDEVRGITGEKSYVTEVDLDQMKYLKAVIKETLRLHPPVPLLVPRQTTQNVKINGYDIPAETIVIINAWTIQRDPVVWDEPDKFNPERFLNSQTDYRGKNLELIPFGVGRRMCPGISFAMASNELVLANLMHKLDWKLANGEKGENLDMTEHKGITVRRKTPLLAIATSRK